MIPPTLNKFLPVSLLRTGAIALSGLGLTGFLWIIDSESLKAQGPLSIPQTQPGAGLEFLPPQPPNPTFPENTIPPAGYSPPGYSPNNRQFRQIQSYRLDIGDQITVSVPDFPEFNSSSPVDPDGNFLVPILGRIPVLGLTLDEVQTKIRLELGRKYLREDVVRRVLVDGTVLEEKLDLYTPLIKGERLPDLRLQGGDAVIVSKLEVGQETGYNGTLVARTTLAQQNITIRVLAPLVPSGIALRNVSIPNGSTFLDVVASLPVSDRLRINVNEVSLLRFDSAKGGIVSQTLSPIAAVRGDISQNVPLEDQDVIIVTRTLLGEIFAAFNIITQPIRDITSFTNTILNLSNQFDNFR